MANAVGSALGGAGTGAAVGSAVAPGVGTAVGAGVGAAAGLIGYLIESDAQEEANKIIKRAQDAYGSLDDSAIVAAAREVLGPTGLASIQADPKYRAMQDEALAELSGIGRTGLSMSNRADLADAMSEAAFADKAGRESIMQNFEARGLGGSGLELVSQLSAQQANANRANASARRVAGDAQDQALRALSMSANMAGNLENRDYGRQADAARAQDDIDRFNNTTRYQRAQAEYGRQLDNLDREYDFAAQNAGREEAQGKRAGQVAGGVGNEIGKTITRGANAYDGSGDDTYHTSNTTKSLEDEE